MRITWIGILVVGFFLAAARTMRTVARTRGERPFRRTPISPLETLVLFWGRLKHLLCGMTGASRVNEATSGGRGLCAAFKWMMMRLPADRVGSTEAMLAEDAKKPVVPPVAAPKLPKKKSKSSKAPEPQVPAAPAQPQAAKQAHKKRHSMPTLVPTVSSSAAFEQSLESQLHMIAEDHEEKHAEEALATEPSEAESATGDEQQVRTWRSLSKDGTAEQGAVAPGSAPSTADAVQSRFAKYFNSISSEGAHAIPGRGHAGSTGTQDGIEAQLKSGALLSPPGYGRRTKSMAPSGKYQPPMTVSVPTETLAPTQHSYRRPTGTFASKGYALTRASVFAARASPVPENMAPLEKRTKDFFSHRKSSGASTGSSSRVSSPVSEGRPVVGALSAAASPHKVFEPAGRRRSFYPPSWTPWTDEESVVPAGSRAAGVIGSRAGSTASPDAQDDPQQGSFSLFNMDLFHTTTSPFAKQ